MKYMKLNVKTQSSGSNDKEAKLLNDKEAALMSK